MALFRSVLTLAICVFLLASTAVAADHFANRRREIEREKQAKKQQEASQRRTVRTFTIPQPSYGGGFDSRFDPRFDPRYSGYDPRFDRRYGSPQYVLVPGHYQAIGGQLIYVPPYYQLVP